MFKIIGSIFLLTSLSFASDFNPRAKTIICADGLDPHNSTVVTIEDFGRTVKIEKDLNESAPYSAAGRTFYALGFVGFDFVNLETNQRQFMMVNFSEDEVKADLNKSGYTLTCFSSEF